MIKSTTREAKQAINKYIIDTSIDYLTECEYIQDGAAFEDVKRAIVNAFINEKMKNYASAKQPFDVLKIYYKYNLFEAFKEWASGLACGSTFDYYYNISAVDLVGDWLQQTTEERNKYDELDAEEYATQLIFRQLDVRKYFFELGAKYEK